MRDLTPERGRLRGGSLAVAAASGYAAPAASSWLVAGPLGRLAGILCRAAASASETAGRIELVPDSPELEVVWAGPRLETNFVVADQ